MKDNPNYKITNYIFISRWLCTQHFNMNKDLNKKNALNKLKWNKLTEQKQF